MHEDYIAPYPNWETWYIINEDMDIANIYKNNKVRHYLEKIFVEDWDQDKIRKGTLKVNLSVQDGLTGIIIAIREALAHDEEFEKLEKSWDEPEEGDYNYHNYQIRSVFHDLFELNEETGIRTIDSEKSDLKKSLKDLIDTQSITYNRKGWLDINKIAKILTNARRNDLDAFASLLQSKTNVAMATKEMYNAKELVKNKLINEDNVLQFLCDFNSDGQISAEYNKKLNLRQKNQWDVGPLFGQQVYFCIEQAIKVQNVIDSWKGEQVVISNIFKNMAIADSRTLEHTHLNTMKNDPSKCTRENLALLIHWDEEKWIYPMPEMKTLFLDTIKRMNGGSGATTPELYDNLVGKDIEIGMELLTAEHELKQNITQAVTNSKDPEIQALIEKHGVVYVRETFFTKIMTVINNVEITTNNGAVTTLQAAGISKWWEIQKLKGELIEKITQQILTTWIYYMKGKWCILNLWNGKEWTSTSWKTKRAWSVGGGLTIGSDGLSVFLWASGEIAEQFNYKRVINADLSQVRSAHYLGIEWKVRAWAKVDSGSVEASGGLFRHKDPIVGIEQIDEQYKTISNKIFTVEVLQVDTLCTNAKACQKHFEDKINTNTSDPLFGKFITTNEAHLKNNAKFIVRYMEANNMFGEKSILKDKSPNQQKIALDGLFDMLQTGSREARRHDVITWLHGKIDITKLSFGITTSALTASFRRNKTEEPTASATSGETKEEGLLTWGYAGNEWMWWTDTFGIAWFYAGIRISTWKNKYVPNTEKYLFTEYQLKSWWSHFDEITTTSENITIYANYLQAIYNDERLNCEIVDWKIVMTLYDENIDIRKFLNIHATDEAQWKFSIKNNILTIWNVWPIGAYTVTEAKGVRRVLSLGSKKLDETKRISVDYTTTHEVAKIEASHTGYENWTSDKINNNLIPSMTGTWEQLSEAKKITASFFDTEGKLTTPVWATVIFSPAGMEWKEISTGTIVITKKIDETYYVAVGTSPTDELKLEYIDILEHEEALEEEKKKPWSRETISHNVDNLFSFEWELLEVQSILNTLANDIKDFEKSPHNTNKPEYLHFLSAASNILDNDWLIDDKEITKAIQYLQILLPNRPTDLITLKQYLNSWTWYTKSFAVDRLKQIFAKDRWYSGKKISFILEAHNTWREKLTWPSSTPLPKELLDELRWQRNIRKKTPLNYDDSPQQQTNLVWYTAFYRYTAWDQYKNVKFSMTSLGNTSSQVEPYPIKDNREQAKTWFLWNLEKNKYEVQQLAISLQEQFSKKWANIQILDTDYTKTLENLKKLLNWDELILDSSQKISIDIDYVFYLLGECVNESIGIDIKNITISSLQENIILPGKYTAEGTPDKIYEYETWVSGKIYSISSKVIPTEYKAWRTHHQTINKKPWAAATSWETQDPEPIDTETDNNEIVGGNWETQEETGNYSNNGTENIMPWDSE